MSAGAALLRWGVPILGAALALALIFALYRDLDLSRFLAALAGARPGWLAALAATILLEQVIRGWKWRLILYELKPVPTWRLVGAVLAGYGAATLIPLGVSPLVRAWLIARLEALRMASVLVTTVIERFVDGVVFALLAGLAALTVRLPGVDGDLRAGLAAAGALNLILFGGLLWLLFRSRTPLGRGDARVSRAVDWLAARGGPRLAGLRAALAEGVVWPRDRLRAAAVVGASLAMKLVAATHLLWAGLAVGVLLTAADYLFLMVVAGVAMVLARFVRVPGGFVLGAGFALAALGVAEEQALAMVLFNAVFSMALMVGVGLTILWRHGLTIRALAAARPG